MKCFILLLVVSQAFCQNDDSYFPDYFPDLCTIGKVVAVAVGGAAAVVVAPVVLAGAGFTADGVAAGSLAAGIQATFYAGAAQGVFLH